MMRRFLTTSVLFLLATAAAATTSSQAEADTMAASILDTKENRVAQAKRVLLGQPIEETLEGIVQEAVKVKGVEYSEEIRKAIAKSDTSELSGAMERAYATTFTAAELAFLADYANSEIGRRVQKKMPNYVAKVHPAMKAYATEIFESVKAKQEEGSSGGSKEGKAAAKKAKAVPAEEIKVAAGSAEL